MPITIEKLTEELQKSLNSRSSQINIAGDDATLIALQEEANQDEINRAREAFLKHPRQSELVVVREDGTIVCSYRYQKDLQGTLSLQKENTVQLFDRMHASLKLDAPSLTAAAQVKLFEQMLAHSTEKTAVVENFLSLVQKGSGLDAKTVLESPSFVHAMFAQSQGLARIEFIAWCCGYDAEHAIDGVTQLIKDTVNNKHTEQRNRLEAAIPNHIGKLLFTVVNTVLTDSGYWRLSIDHLEQINEMLTKINIHDSKVKNRLKLAKKIGYYYFNYQKKLAAWSAKNWFMPPMSTSSLRAASLQFIATATLNLSTRWRTARVLNVTAESEEMKKFSDSLKLAVQQVFDTYIQTISGYISTASAQEKVALILPDLLKNPVLAQAAIIWDLVPGVNAHRFQIDLMREIIAGNTQFPEVQWRAVQEIFSMQGTLAETQEMRELLDGLVTPHHASTDEQAIGLNDLSSTHYTDRMHQLQQLGQWVSQLQASIAGEEEFNEAARDSIDSMSRAYLVAMLENHDAYMVSHAFLTRLGELGPLPIWIETILKQSATDIFKMYHAALPGYDVQKPVDDPTNAALVFRDLLADPVITKAFITYADEPLRHAVALFCTQLVDKKTLALTVTDYSREKLQAMCALLTGQHTSASEVDQFKILETRQQLSNALHTAQADPVQWRVELGQQMKTIVQLAKPDTPTYDTARTLFLNSLTAYQETFRATAKADWHANPHMAVMIALGLQKFPPISPDEEALSKKFTLEESAWIAALKSSIQKEAQEQYFMSGLMRPQNRHQRPDILTVMEQKLAHSLYQELGVVEMRAYRSMQGTDPVMLKAIKLMAGNVILYVQHQPAITDNDITVYTQKEWEAKINVLSTKYTQALIGSVMAKSLTQLPQTSNSKEWCATMETIAIPDWARQFVTETHMHREYYRSGYDLPTFVRQVGESEYGKRTLKATQDFSAEGWHQDKQALIESMTLLVQEAAKQSVPPALVSEIQNFIETGRLDSESTFMPPDNTLSSEDHYSAMHADVLVNRITAFELEHHVIAPALFQLAAVLRDYAAMHDDDEELRKRYIHVEQVQPPPSLPEVSSSSQMNSPQLNEKQPDSVVSAVAKSGTEHPQPPGLQRQSSTPIEIPVKANRTFSDAAAQAMRVGAVSRESTSFSHLSPLQSMARSPTSLSSALSTQASTSHAQLLARMNAHNLAHETSLSHTEFSVHSSTHIPTNFSPILHF